MTRDYRDPRLEREKQEVVEEAERLANPTILDEYKTALRLEAYEEAGRLWNQMTSDEKAEARETHAHRVAVRKFAIYEDEDNENDFDYTDPVAVARDFDEYANESTLGHVGTEDIWEDLWPTYVQKIHQELSDNESDESTPEYYTAVHAALGKVYESLINGTFQRLMTKRPKPQLTNWEKKKVIEEAERLANPTILDEYKTALRLEAYEEAGRLWNQMTPDEKAQAREIHAHRIGIRKFAFNDMFGKGWDSGRQYSYCMQQSLKGNPQFWWVPEVLAMYPEPPPNWEAVQRQPDGRFKEFPGRGEKKEKKSSWQSKMYRFAWKLYTTGNKNEGRQLLSLLREIK